MEEIGGGDVEVDATGWSSKEAERENEEDSRQSQEREILASRSGRGLTHDIYASVEAREKESKRVLGDC